MKQITTILFLAIQTIAFAQVINQKSIDKINNEIWSRYVNKFDIINDYTELNGNILWPTPDEIKLGKPNALGWWTPIENGSMFGGLYMDGAIKRWEYTKKPEDSVKVKRLAKGLMRLATVSPVEGMFARGVTSDGISYYPMGSDDQAGGWYYGMWRYLQTNLLDSIERNTIEKKFISASKAIVKLNWALPSDTPYNKRGTFASFDYRAARLLFVCKSSYLITKDPYWQKLYLEKLYEIGGTQKKSRLTILNEGLNASIGTTWHNSPSVACLRLLWELEEDTLIKNAYERGLEITANYEFEKVKISINMSYTDTASFDWRVMNALWRIQKTDTAAENVGNLQLSTFWNRPKKRWGVEHLYLREPCFNAWHITLAPNKAILKRRLTDLARLIEHFNYKNIFEVWYFPLEAASWRLNDLQ